MESFTERLIHLRHSNNLTRQQVRDSLNINNVSTYNRWEMEVEHLIMKRFLGLLISLRFLLCIC